MRGIVASGGAENPAGTSLDFASREIRPASKNVGLRNEAVAARPRIQN